MKTCWYCGEKELIGDNLSLEHIIPDALGGRLKSIELLCCGCNSSLGHNLDNILTHDLDFYTHIINPIRDKGKKKKGKKQKDRRFTAYEESGKPFKIRRGNKDQSLLTMNIDDKDIILHFDDPSEMLASAKKKLRQLNDAGKEGQLEVYRPEEPFGVVYITKDKTVTFDERTILKPLSKIALNYYVYCTDDTHYVCEMIEILKRVNRGIPVSRGRFFYSPIPLYEETENEVSHNLLLLGDPQQRTLIAFVEVLSLYSALFVLNLDYDGVFVEKSYSYDVVTGREIDRNLTLDRNRNFYEQIQYQPKRQDHFLMQQKLDRLIGILNREENKEIFRSR